MYELLKYMKDYPETQFNDYTNTCDFEFKLYLV